MTKRKITGLSVVLAIILAFLPVIVAVIIAYVHTVHLAKAELTEIATEVANKTDAVFQTIHAELKNVESVDAKCQPDDVQELRKLVFNLPIVGEVGLVDPQGYLVCSSLGKIEHPIKIPDVNPGKGYHFLGPITMEKIQKKILIEGVTRKDGSSINVFIIPWALMNGISQDDVGEQGFVAIVRPHDKHIYAQKGKIPNLDITMTENNMGDGFMGYRMRFDDGIERFVVAIKLNALDHVWAVSAVSKAWILEGWKKMAVILGLLGLLVSIALVSLVIFLTRRRLSLQSELTRAIQRNELVVYYQPVVELKTQQCVGAEALLRWQHPEEGLVAPDLFIPLAEATGLIEPMTEWMMQRVCDDLESWLRKNPSVHVAINLSQKHFESERILTTSEAVFGKSAIDARQLIYEMTERGLVSDEIGMARHVMNVLRKRGSAIALDDFGTGYSSLSYLGTFSLDYLKIDKQFVDAIGQQAVTTHLVEAIIHIAKQLHLKIIAEGVETQQQADYLVQHGVEYAQGWLFAKALPKDQFLEWLSS
jgi:sensor c-di-GMP phosphodiesterase-like protein